MLKNKVILVTGSGKGIGATIAKKASIEGAKVIVNYLKDEESAHSTFEKLKNNEECLIIRADVTEEEGVAKLFEKIEKKYNTLDVLINCAHSPFDIKSSDSLNWIDIQTQLNGTVKSSFNCIKTFLPFLKKSQGNILNISSITVHSYVNGFMHRNLAKAALENFTKNLAVELAEHNIKVNALALGWTRTDQFNSFTNDFLNSIKEKIPLKRFATTEEVAEFALFLISSTCNYLTGSIISFDGGLSCT